MAQHSNYWFSTCPTKNNVTSGLVRNIDVLIIGGGIAGITLLHQLINAGITNCYLVEESSVGSHASGRNNGQLFLGTNNLFHKMDKDIGPAYLSFIADNNKKLVGGLRAIKFNDGLLDTGGIRLALSANELEDLQRESDFIDVHQNLKCLMLSQNDVQVLFPGSQFVGGMFVPTEALFNPYKIINGLRELVECKGPRILTNCCVSKVQRNTDDSFSVSIRHKGIIKTKSVVYCTNVYTSELVPELAPNIIGHRNQIIATEILPDDLVKTFPQMSISCNYGFEYMRLHDNRLLVGGMRHAVRNKQVGVLDDGEISPVVYDRIRSFITDYMPMFSGIKYEFTWSNVVCTTTDKLPLVGQLPNRPHEYVMCGFGGYGFSHALNSSLIIRDLLIKGSSSCNLFNPGRFHV